MELNKITTSFPLVLNAKSFGDVRNLLENKECIEHEMIDFSHSRELLINSTSILINQSAHAINLICSNNDEQIEKDLLNEIPVRLKGRIRPIYLNKKLSNRFLSFVEPIYNDKISSPIIDILVNDLYSFLIASKQRTEVDAISLFQITKNWEELFKNSQILKDSDVKYLFDQLNGLINVYKYSESIECFIDENKKIPIDKRLEDILNDAHFEKLSREKYLFGIPNKAKMAVFNFKQLINDKILPNLGLSLKPLLYSTSPINLDIRKQMDQKVGYSPPIYSLDEILYSTINEYLTKNSLDRLYFLNSMPFNKAGWIIHECNSENGFEAHLITGKECRGEYILRGSWGNVIGNADINLKVG